MTPPPHARPAPPVTLAAVASRAAVHVSTVSRALAPGSPGVGAATAARIYEGIDAAAAEAGYNTFVANTTDDPGLRRIRLDGLLSRRVDGIVLGDARLHGDELVQTLAAKRIPYVLVSRRLRGHLSVTTDDLMGGRLAAQHLLELGHERVAVVAGEPYASTGVERTAGFRRAYAEAGLPVPDDRVLHSRFDVEGGHAAAAVLLDLRPRPTAIFAVNDTAAVGVMGALRERGLRPGTDVAVVGYNDIPLAADLPVPLTSVHSPMFEMGSAALAVLLTRLQGQPVRSRRLRPELVARASTLGDRSRTRR